MKKAIGLIIVSQLFFICLVAQTSTPAVDKSPMDMSYFPVSYPVLKMQDKATEPLVTRVIYSRPQKSGRAIFGGLVKNGEVWRLGANEATEIEFFKPVRLGGKKIPKGRYTLYALINENTWTFIVNKETDIWGAFSYNAKKDLVRYDVSVQKNDTPAEYLGMSFEKTTTGFNLNIVWDNVKVSVPFTL
jgi:hypothetical protein